MKKLLITLSLFIAIQAVAQDGIRFEHCSWADVKAKALKENKLIFADFYTQWCGPCLAMAEDVFVLESVGNLYNANFVNVKIDTENGEGVELAKKYQISSYPTFVFIDPKTEEAVHVSGSRQDKETFLFTGKSALDPQKRSPYLAAQHKAGDGSAQFLLNYARYQASRYNRAESTAAFEKLVQMPGYSLDNPEIWDFFFKNINGRDNGLFKALIADPAKYIAIHGQKAVDEKLFKEYNYCPDAAELTNAPQFKGKEFLQLKNEAERLVKAEKFEEAAQKIDQLMLNPGDFKEELCNYLRFTSRAVQYGEYPKFWNDKCLAYAQYTAYNMPNRDDATAHFDYAILLEKLLKTMPADQLPDCLKSQPQYGAKDYSMRPQNLKQKPKRKK